MILMALGLITATMFWINMWLFIPTPFWAMNLLGIITGVLIMAIGIVDELEFFSFRKVFK